VSVISALFLLLGSGAVLLFCDSGPISMCYFMSKLAIALAIIQIILPISSKLIINSLEKKVDLLKINLKSCPHKI